MAFRSTDCRTFSVAFAGCARLEHEPALLSSSGSLHDETPCDTAVHYVKLRTVPSHEQMHTVLRKFWNLGEHAVLLRVIGGVESPVDDRCRQVFDALVRSAKLSGAMVVTDGETKFANRAPTLIGRASEHSWLPLIGIYRARSVRDGCLEEEATTAEKYRKNSVLRGVGNRHTGIFLLQESVRAEAVHLMLQLSENAEPTT